MLGVAIPAVGSAPMPTTAYSVSTRERSHPLRQRLGQVTRRRGPSVADNLAELEALLYQDFQHDVALLLSVPRAGILAELVAAPNPQAVAACVERSVQSLVSAHSLSSDDARWAIETWAVALGIGVE